MDDANVHLAGRDDLPVLERLERVVRLGERVDRDRQPVLEREPSVPGDVVGMGMRLEHALDAHALLLGKCEVLLDRERGIDDHGDSRLRIPDEVRRAPEILVHELPEEQHGS